MERKKDRFYVYAHYDTAGELRYIGKGCGHRASARHGRNPQWRALFDAFGPRVEFIETGLTERESCEREILEISEARARGCNLLNISDGGDTSVWTDEARARLSELRKGKGYWKGKTRGDFMKKLKAIQMEKCPAPWLGKKRDPELMAMLVAKSHTPEAIAKTSAKMRGRKLTEEHKAKIGRPGRIVPKEVGQAISAAKKGRPNGLLGRVMPDEHRAKIAAARLASDAVKASSEQIWATRRANGTDRGYTTKKARPVRCLETGVVYRCAKDAATELGLSDKHIQACCVGRRKVTGKRHFEYQGAT